MEMLKGLAGHMFSIAGGYYTMGMAVLFVHCFLDPGVLWDRKKKQLLLLTVAADEVLNTFWENQAAVEAIVFLAYFWVFAFGCGEKCIRRSLKVFGAFLYFVCCFVMVAGVGEYNFAHTIFAENFAYQYEVVCAACGGILYYYFTVKFFQKDLVVLLGKREKWLLAFYIIYLISFYGMFLVTVEEGQGTSVMLERAMGIVVLAFSVVLPFYILKARVSDYYKDRKDCQEEYLQAQLSYFQQYKENQEETRRFRHDLKNHLLFLSAMMQEGKTQEAETYLDGMLKQTKALSPEIVTGDEMLDCIFSSKLRGLSREGISFRIEGVLEGGLGLSPMDACCVFANALDNAIEACKKIPEGEKREICISLKKTEQFFCIEITNTAAQNPEGEKLFSSQGSFTSKKNRNLHGFGIYNMRRTVEKYGGIFRFECRGKKATVSIMINRAR